MKMDNRENETSQDKPKKANQVNFRATDEKKLGWRISPKYPASPKRICVWRPSIS